MTAGDEEGGGGGGGGKAEAAERKEPQQQQQQQDQQRQSLIGSDEASMGSQPSIHYPQLAVPSTPPSAHTAAAVYNVYPHRLPRFYPPAVPSSYNPYPAFYPLYPKQAYTVSPSHTSPHSPSATSHSPDPHASPSEAAVPSSSQQKSRKSRRSRKPTASHHTNHHTNQATAGGEDEESDSSDDSDDEEEEEEGQASRRPSLSSTQPPPSAQMADLLVHPSHTKPSLPTLRFNNNDAVSTVRMQPTVYPPPSVPQFAGPLPSYHPYYQAAMAHTLPAAHSIPHSHTLRTGHISPIMQPVTNGELSNIPYEHSGGDAYDEQAEGGELYTLPTAASVQQQQQQQQHYVYQHHPYFYHQPQRSEQQQQQTVAAIQQRFAATVDSSPHQPAAVDAASAGSSVLRSPPILHPSSLQQQQLTVSSLSPHRQVLVDSYPVGVQSPQSASSMSVSRTTQASPLSATSDVPDELDEASQAHVNASLPTYSSAYQHMHHAHKMTRSVDDFDIHLHNHPPQAEPNVQQPHQPQQQQQLHYEAPLVTSHYHYAHPRTASDDLTYALHSLQLHTLSQQQPPALMQQQQQEQAYAEPGSDGLSDAGRSARPTVEYQHYHGAKGRIFRVRDITSSYAEGEDSRRASRRSSYAVHASPSAHPAYSPYMPDSPHRYATHYMDHSNGQQWEYAAVDTFSAGHAVPLAPLPSAHPAALPFHRVSTAPSDSKKAKAKKHRKDEIHFADLRFGAKIGEGSFGEVFRGSLWGQEVAIKKLRIQAVDGAAVSKEFKKEVKIMRTLRHPNIVEFLGVCMEPPNLCLVTEYLSNGSLEDVLTRVAANNGKKFSLKRIISLAKDIARGLNWLHHKGIIHRDLKSANILLDANGKAKICFPQDDHEVLTRDGFKSFDYFQRALDSGEAVSVACPVRRFASDPLDQLALEYHDVLGLDSLVDNTTTELVEMRCQPTVSTRRLTKDGRERTARTVSTNHMDLQLTPEHQLPVGIGAYHTASSKARAAVQRLSAREVLDAHSELGRRPGSAVECAHFVCHAVHGVSDPTPHLPLPFAAALGLTTDDEVDAFVELYGYWLGVGSLSAYETEAITLSTYKDVDVEYLDDLFSRLPLCQLAPGPLLDRRGFQKLDLHHQLDDDDDDDDDEDQYANDDNDGEEGMVDVVGDEVEDEQAAAASVPAASPRLRCEQCSYRIYHPTWFRYFAEQYGHNDWSSPSGRLAMHSNSYTSPTRSRASSSASSASSPASVSTGVAASWSSSPRLLQRSLDSVEFVPDSPPPLDDRECKRLRQSVPMSPCIVKDDDEEPPVSAARLEVEPQRSKAEDTSSATWAWWWVWQRLCARRLRLLLRGLRFADDDQKRELSTHRRLMAEAAALRTEERLSDAAAVDERLRTCREQAMPLTTARIHTASARCREEYLHMALRAGFSAAASLKQRVGHAHAIAQTSTRPLWQVAYKGESVNSVRPRLVIHPSEQNAAKYGIPQLANKEVNLLRLSTPRKVWCLTVPTADHLIIVRRVRRDDSGHIVHSSRPTVVGNCDFGLSHVKRRVDLSGSYGICGTPSYMAPEVLRKQSYGVKADVFSFGICLCELITGKYPYDSDNQSTRTFEDAIVAGLRPIIPAYCPLSIKHLIQSCWADDPDQRPSVDEIMDTLVLTERQLLAAENLTILDEMPEEIAKLFEDQKAENAFLAMSIKQLKGQLDAAQARASEWEEKWNEERVRREEAERSAKQLREQVQQLVASGASGGGSSITSSSPLLSMAVPVLMRGTSNAPSDGSLTHRRLSTGGASMAAVSRSSSSSGGGGVGGGAIASPRALQRPLLHTTTTANASPQPTPLISPSATPSPTHSIGLLAAALFAATPSPTHAASAGHSIARPATPVAASQPLHYQPTYVPPASFLTPAHSAPLSLGSPVPPASLQLAGYSPASSSPSRSDRSASPGSTSPRQQDR